MDLEVAAIRLISSQLCPIVCSSDGIIYWSKKGQLSKEFAQITPIGYTRQTIFHLESKLDESYALEGFSQFAQMKAVEFDIFSERIREDTPYIRGFLELFTINVSDKQILLYPQVKIYSNGVLTVSFRILSSSNSKYPIKSLIDNEINLFRHNTTDIMMPCSVLKLFIKASLFYDELPIFLKYKWKQEVKKLVKLIDEKTTSTKQGDFEFNVCSAEFLQDSEIPELNFSTIVHCCLAAIFAALNASKGEKPRFNMGHFWIGRPQVYILEFENQPKSANRFSHFAGEFGKILARVSDMPSKIAARYFPDSLRLASDDIGIYLNQGIGLWIYSRNGIEQEQVYEDANEGHLIYPNHIKAELIDYFYTSFKRLHERSLSRFSKIDDLIKEKEFLFQLKTMLNNISNYGEINDMFKNAWNVLNIDGLEKSIHENLSLRTEEIRETKNWRVIRFGWFVSFIFSLLGTIQLSEKIVKPIWQYFGFWVPNDANLLVPFLFILIVSCLGVLILIVRFLWYKLK